MAPSSKMTDDASAGKTSTELEAEALEREAEAKLLRAKALRAREVERRAEMTKAPTASAHMTRSQYAHRSHVSEATVSRWIASGMPTVPVGTTHRIDSAAADEWRRCRPRTATTPKKASARKDDGIDVSAELATAGIRRLRGRS